MFLENVDFSQNCCKLQRGMNVSKGIKLPNMPKSSTKILMTLATLTLAARNW